MKIFLSYRYTGEDLSVLEEIIHKIISVIQNRGNEIFCSFDKNTFFKENNFSYKQILEYALNELNSSDYVLAFVKSEEKSEGMLLELGYAIAKKKKIILAIKDGVYTTFLPHMAYKVLTFSDLDNLYKQLEELKLD